MPQCNCTAGCRQLGTAALPHQRVVGAGADVPGLDARQPVAPVAALVVIHRLRHDLHHAAGGVWGLLLVVVV